MPFNTISFLLFFLCFLSLFHALARTGIQRLWLIIIGSLFFYGMWDYRFITLLLSTAMADFYFARAIGASSTGSRKKFFLFLSITTNLGVLAFFKYSNFFLENAVSVFSAFGWKTGVHPLRVILPVGISFYTFQSMGYVMDVYRGTLTARKHPAEFLAGVSFFPHLVAGPIIRATTLLPQFEHLSLKIERKDWERGALLITSGLCKKGMADLLAIYANSLFNSRGTPEILSAWMGTLAFAGQIYGDFSGYTDMAIGIALFLGIKLPPNFNLPYLATSAIDFWRRWHISLSTWLRDYLYIPLGGNQRRCYRNLLITMLLGGLWHGASWTFVLWGFYHGILLVAAHALRKLFPDRKSGAGNPLVISGQIFLNFYFVLVGWVLFRSPTIQEAWRILRSMHAFATWPPWDMSCCLGFFIVAGLLISEHLLDLLVRFFERQQAAPLWIWGCVGTLAALGLALSGQNQPFIYFQF